MAFLSRIVLLPNTRLSSGGFTLVEVMVALVVLTVGILGWMTFQGSNAHDRALSQEMTRALQITQAKLDEVSAQVSDWDDTQPNVNGSADGATESLDLEVLRYDSEWWVTGAKPVGAERQFWEVRVATRWGDPVFDADAGVVTQSRTLVLSQIVAGK